MRRQKKEKILIYLDLLHGVSAVGVNNHDAAAGGVLAPSLPTADVPRVADHQLEVIIVINSSRNSGVVSAELVEGDLNTQHGAEYGKNISSVDTTSRHLSVSVTALKRLHELSK
jgi:hypothetical protein